MIEGCMRGFPNQIPYRLDHSSVGNIKPLTCIVDSLEPGPMRPTMGFMMLLSLQGLLPFELSAVDSGLVPAASWFFLDWLAMASLMKSMLFSRAMAEYQQESRMSQPRVTLGRMELSLEREGGGGQTLSTACGFLSLKQKK